MRKLRAFRTMIANGFVGVWRNKGMGLVSTATIFAVMLLVGILLLLALNLNGYVKKLNSYLDQVVVFLYDEVTGEETESLLTELSHKEEIDKLTYVSREQAVLDAQEKFSNEDFVLSGLEKNPFPASIMIEINDINKADDLVKILDQDDRVEKTRYYKDLIDKVVKIDNVIKIGSFIAFILISLLSIFVISNIIKVAISSRGAEIEIMKYVGASESFIKGPFIIEGLFYTILGSTLAFFAIKIIYNKFIDIYARPIYDYLEYNIINFKDISIDIGIIFLSIAILIGTIGSLTSIRKYLKV